MVSPYSNAGEKRRQVAILGGTRRIKALLLNGNGSICQPQGLGFESLLRSQNRVQNSALSALKTLG